MSSPLTPSAAGSGPLVPAASYPTYPSSAPSCVDDSIHAPEGEGGEEEDDDGLPPLTSADYVRLFEASISVSLNQQAEMLLMTGGGVGHHFTSATPEGCAPEEDIGTLSHTQPSILRRIVWQRFLGLLHGDNPLEWEKQVKANRAFYVKLQEEQQLSAKRLTSLDPQRFHPLASTADNPWSQKQQNDCLLEEIWKDIERTFADRALFCRDTTRKSLQRILFMWSRQNQDVSYKQGMNELLAIFYLICSRENLGASTASHPKSVDKQTSMGPSPEASPVSEPMRVLLSGGLDDIEADTFSLFNTLMNTFLMKAAYLPAPPPPSKPAMSSVHTNLLKGSGPLGRTLVGSSVGVGAAASLSNQPQQSAILWRCSYIFDTLLRKTDSVLYAHLKEIDIQPQLFLLRWLRLLFSREFHVQDTLLIWDALFADAYLQNPLNDASQHHPALATGSSPSISSSLTRASTTAGITSHTSTPTATRTLGGASTRGGTDLLHSSSTTRFSSSMGGSGPLPLGGVGLGVSSQSSSSSSHQPDKLGAAASAKLPLTDYFALAMLKFVRENLLDSDETLCLRRLLKFPPIESLQPLILLALSLRSGQRRKRQNETSRGDAVSPTISPSSGGSASRTGRGGGASSSSARQEDNEGLYKLSPDGSSMLSSSSSSSPFGHENINGSQGDERRKHHHSHADHCASTRKHTTTPLSPNTSELHKSSSHTSISSSSRQGGGPIHVVGGGGLAACVVTSSTTPQAQHPMMEGGKAPSSQSGMNSPSSHHHHRHSKPPFPRKHEEDGLDADHRRRTKGTETQVLVDHHRKQRGEGTIHSSRTSLSGTALGQHVADIVATLQEAATTEAQMEKVNGCHGISSAGAPSSSHTVSLLLSSALSRLVLVQRVLEGDVEYNPSLFADSTGELTRSRVGNGDASADVIEGSSGSSCKASGIEPTILGAEEIYGSEGARRLDDDRDSYGRENSKKMADNKTARRSVSPLPVVSGSPSTSTVFSPGASEGIRPTLL
ncbi:tbc1 domain family member 5 [Cystoisospora suis]|uniref:Tbc1 domain family member 5 n=1 Tax=Cystoisospora suis TaxID=483139 RepID=A0A2C6LAP5_9APIC|nr:tbc1 domain family member 5 [Cystoisospora suis]